MKLSVSQAARAAGRSKSQISRLMKNGRLSADRSVPSRPMVDASELLRVFPGADVGKRDATFPRATSETPRETGALQAHLDLLLDERDRLRAELDRERAERREERDQQRQERERLIGVVESAQRALADLRPRPPDPATETRGLWRRLFRG
jgi:hypothetical protein